MLQATTHNYKDKYFSKTMANICVLQPQRNFRPENLYVKKRQLRYPENLLYISIPDIQDCIWTLKRDDLPPLFASCKVTLDEWKHIWDLVSDQVKSEMELRERQKRINIEVFHDVCKVSRRSMACCFLCCFTGELKETLVEVDSFNKEINAQWYSLAMNVSGLLGKKYGISVTLEEVNDERDATYGLRFATNLKNTGGAKRWF